MSSDLRENIQITLRLLRKNSLYESVYSQPKSIMHWIRADARVCSPELAGFAICVLHLPSHVRKRTLAIYRSGSPAPCIHNVLLQNDQIRIEGTFFPQQIIFVSVIPHLLIYCFSNLQAVNFIGHYKEF